MTLQTSPNDPSSQNHPSAPSSSSRPDNSAARNGDGGSILKGKRALICEDEGVIQVQLNRALELAGVEVVGSAADGHTAVEIALRERPDIILMDLNVPVVDGMEAARRILVEYNPCLVMVTAYGDRDFRKRADEIGASGYIVKPVTADVLLPQLEEALHACEALL